MPQPDHAGRSGYLGWRIAAAIVSLLVYPPSLRADPVSSHELLQIDAGTYNGNFVNDDREQFFVGSGRGFEFNLFAFPGETGGTLLRDVGAVPFAVDPSLEPCASAPRKSRQPSRRRFVSSRSSTPAHRRCHRTLMGVARS